MPLSSGMSIHDDTKHKGSAKRDAVSGVAALNGGGDLLVLGSDIRVARDILGRVRIVERTSAETVFYFTRVGVDDYTAFVHSGGVGAAIQLDNMKGAANGIAGLDASALLPEVLFPGILNKYVISDNLHTVAAFENNTFSVPYVKKPYMRLSTLYPNPSTIRVSFELKTTNVGVTAYGRIYKNGTPVGVERTTNSISYVTFSEDLQFNELDFVELWISTEVDTHAAYCQNLTVYGDEHAQTLAEAIVQGDIGVSDCLQIV